MSDYLQVIPTDITKLQNYSVPRELFICTSIILLTFLLISLILMFVWIYRTHMGYTNIDYVADYAVKK